MLDFQDIDTQNILGKKNKPGANWISCEFPPIFHPILAMFTSSNRFILPGMNCTDQSNCRTTILEWTKHHYFCSGHGMNPGIHFLLLMLISQCLLGFNRTQNIGDNLRITIPAGGFITTIAIGDTPEGSLQMLKSIALSQLMTEILKDVTQKRRPNGSCCESFPSGHVSASFTGAAFIHQRYGWRWAILPYLGATFVGYSRIHAHRHDLEDVLVGAAIGLWSSATCTNAYHGFLGIPSLQDGQFSIQFSIPLGDLHF